MRELTKLEKGIFVSISPSEFKKLKDEMGFLSRTYYPEQYEKISEKDEIGRFLIFRFKLDNN